MGAGNPIHDFGTGHADAEGHSGSDALGDADHVRLDAGMLDGPPLSSPTCAALDFVDDEENAVTIADGTQFAHEVVRSNDITAFALDWFDEDSCYFFRGNGGFEKLFLDEAGTAESEGFLFLRTAGTPAIGVWEADVGDAGNEWREPSTLLRLGACEGKRAHGAAVEAAEEGDDLLAASVVPGKFEGTFDCFSAGVSVEKLVRTGHWRDSGEAFGEVSEVLVVEVCARDVDELGSLFLDRCNYFRMAVAGGNNGDAGRKIEELVPIDIFKASSAAATSDERIGACIAWGNEAFVGGDGCFGLAAWEWTFELGSELRVDFLLGHIASPRYLRAGTSESVRRASLCQA